MTDPTQERIARWMGMRKGRYGPLWFKRLSHDTCRLPNLDTESGAALWVAWIKAEFGRRKWWGKIIFSDCANWRVAVWDDNEKLVEVENHQTELDALTAAVLKIMESEE